MKAAWNKLHDLLSGMLHWVEGLAQTPTAEWALFAIAFAESSFFPIPPDVLLIALCLGDPSKALWFALLCSVGSVLGGMFGYGVGYWGGRPLVQRLFDERKVEAVRRLYDRYNAWATGIAGLTPLPYKIFTLSAGALGVDFKVFALASVVARSLRFFAVAGLLYWLGEPAKQFIEEYLNLFSILFVVLLVGSFWLLSRWTSQAGEEDVGDSEQEHV